MTDAARAWLPPGARAAVCFSVDDVHPAGTTPGGDADVARAALDVLARLQERHPHLRVTFFTTPDWRSASPFPSARGAARIPLLRNMVFQTPLLPEGACRLARHPVFCATLRTWPGGEVALHGLRHVRRGPAPTTEFAGLGRAACRALLARASTLFEEAGLPYVRGLCPPGWVAPPPLVRVLAEDAWTFLASARDLETPPAAGAVAQGSGLRGVPLFAPSLLAGTRVAHVPTNFQATSDLGRARAVVEAGGLLSIKAHLLAELGAYRALDGLTPGYGERLHGVLSSLEDSLGSALWWPSMSDLADAVRGAEAA